MKKIFTSLLLPVVAGLLAHSPAQAQQLLYSNGSFSTGPTAKIGTVAPAGYTWSELQNDAANTAVSNGVTGFSSLRSSGSELADDFVVPAGQTWTLSTVSVFCYQTGAIANPFNALYFRIWDGPPTATTSQVVFGSLTTNRYTSSTDALAYRIFNSQYPTAANVPETTRRIWRVQATLILPLTLPAGTYWISYSTGSPTSGSNFSVPVTPVGLRQPVGANALQPLNGSWVPLRDSGVGTGAAPVGIEMAFELTGTSVLGVKSGSPEFALRVGPVPTSHVATAEFSALKKPAAFVLTDMQGRRVWEAASTTGSTSLQVPLANVAADAYLLTMTSELGVSRARLLKQ